MKNKMTGLIIGGLITASVLGVTFGVSNAAKAEEKAAEPNMMQQGQMNPDMMNSKDMQKQCGEMMASPEMQKNMKAMMKNMMANDPEMKQMMTDMMKSTNTKPTVNAE
jgi:periplasmic protein CpxP/Spy